MPTIKPIDNKPITPANTDTAQASLTKATFRDRMVKEAGSSGVEGVQSRSVYDALPELPSEQTNRSRKIKQFFARVLHPQTRATNEDTYATIDEAKTAAEQYRVKGGPDYATVKQAASLDAALGSVRNQEEDDYTDMSGVRSRPDDTGEYVDMGQAPRVGQEATYQNVHDVAEDDYTDMSGQEEPAYAEVGEREQPASAIYEDPDAALGSVRNQEEDDYTDMSGVRSRPDDTGEYVDMGQAPRVGQEATYQNVHDVAEDDYTDMSGQEEPAYAEVGEREQPASAIYEDPDAALSSVRNQEEDDYTDMSGVRSRPDDTGEYVDMGQAPRVGQEATYQNVHDVAEDDYTDMSGQEEPAYAEVGEREQPASAIYEDPDAALSSVRNQEEDDYTDMSGVRSRPDDTGEYVDMGQAPRVGQEATYQNVHDVAEDDYTDMSGQEEPAYAEVGEREQPASAIYEDPDAINNTPNSADNVKEGHS